MCGLWARFLFGLAGLCAAASPSGAAQFELLDDHQIVSSVLLSGTITPGDTDRLARLALSAVRRHPPIGLIVLNSAGGSVVEGARLSKFIQSMQWIALVPSQSLCASACFLVFAAAPSKFYGPGALIGVHSASEAGVDTVEAMAITTAMARFASALNVPPAIIGKMVRTEPGDIEWLSAGDLASMGAVQTQDSAPSDTSPQSRPFRVDTPSATSAAEPMDMPRFCRENFGAKAKAIALDRHDASSWRCRIGKRLVGMSLRDLCHQQYGAAYGYALGDRHDAGSWACVLR